MYEFIKGNIAASGVNYIVIENNGIGFKIFTSANTIAKCNVNDKDILIHTYLHVREDILQLYGFAEKEELSLFNMLIGITGIGPKAALSVLSTFTAKETALAIAGDKPEVLSKAKGIGKKTAQRIILELKDKFKALEKEAAIEGQMEPSDNIIAEEAKTALMVLGYSPREAKLSVEGCLEDNITLEELIRSCLKNLNG